MVVFLMSPDWQTSPLFWLPSLLQKKIAVAHIGRLNMVTLLGPSKLDSHIADLWNTQRQVGTYASLITNSQMSQVFMLNVLS